MEVKQETALEGHLDRVNCVAVTSDNKYIISGSNDRTIRIWNLLEKKQETLSVENCGYVLTVALTRDNKFIISGSADNTIRI